MDTSPRLTVAMPTYNGAKHLGEALRSILAQDGLTFDLIVSDDRSEDETPAIVRDLTGDRARVVINSERLGLAGNWNQCVALSRTPLVAIFHQDDVMRPGHLAAHVSAFDSSDRVGLVASAAEVVDAEGRTVPESVVCRGGLGPSDRRFGVGELVREMAIANPLRCSAVTIRAEAHRAIGGFDSSYRYVVDWDFWLRLARGWEAAWLAQPTVAIRWHPESETHRFKTGTTDLEETIRLRDHLLNSDGPGSPEAPGLRRESNRRLARAYLNRSHQALRGGDSGLATRCLRKAIALRPGILATIAADPRLAVQLSLLVVAPRTAARHFGPSQIS